MKPPGQRSNTVFVFIFSLYYNFEFLYKRYTMATETNSFVFPQELSHYQANYVCNVCVC